MPAQIGHQHPVALGKGLDLVLPLAGVAAEAVDEDQGIFWTLRRHLNQAEGRVVANLYFFPV